jgi:hypothetical protein
MRAFGGGDGDRGGAAWAILFRRLRPFNKAVHLLHDQKDHKGNNEEINDGINEETVIDGRNASRFGEG